MLLLYILLYLFVGVVIGTANFNAAVMYYTVLPIQTSFLIYHYRNKHFVLSCFFSILFLSMGLSSVFFFLNSTAYESTGFSAIGRYDFSLTGYFNAYFKVLLFMLIIHFVANKQQKSIDIFAYLRILIKRMMRISTNRGFEVLLLTSIVLFSAISIWMFNNSIGMTGIQPPKLPYHLSGILYHLRGKVFPLLLFYFYIKSTNKNLAFALVSIFAIIGGFTSCSKGLTMMILVPVIYESFVTHHKLRATIGIVISFILFVLVAYSRELLFAFEQVNDSLASVIFYSFNSLSNANSSWVLKFLDNFTSRLYGTYTIILADQYHLTSISDTLSYYMGFHIEEIIHDYVPTIFGFSLPDDRPFGVGIGYMGTMMLLSSGNYFLVALQAFIMGGIFTFMEARLQNNIVRYNSPIISLASILLAAFCVLRIIEASGMVVVYLVIILIYFLPTIVKILAPNYFQSLKIKRRIYERIARIA